MSSFYAVAVPRETSIPQPLAVFETLAATQEALKRWPGSRFKEFTSRCDAENFAKNHIRYSSAVTEDSQTNSNLEASFVSNYKAPSSSELALFRKAIQQGDINYVKSCVTRNPRFLISSGDCAVVLMEGPRYNASHIACKANQATILAFILQTVNDCSFVRSYYISDTEDTARERANVLLTSYLNTPDKGANDTPLHLACKFGSLECVKLLLSYPQCAVHQVNKLSMTPIQVICDRYSGDTSRKTQLQELFESTYYITILRTDDSVSIGAPQKTITSPNVKAIAGPMSPQDAEKIFKFLKTPDKKSPLTKVRYTDSQKGVEKMARHKCREMNLPFTEDWPFLKTNSLVDLATNDGLNMLESHFENIAKELSKQQQINTDILCQTLESLYISSSKHTDTSRIDDNGDPDSGDDVWFTPPESPIVNSLVYVNFFVYGDEATSWDFAAYDKLADCDNINCKSYPLTYAWFKRIQKLPRNVPKHKKRSLFDDPLNKTL